MRLIGISGALIIFQVSCAPQTTNLGAETAAVPNPSAAGLAPYRQFVLSDRAVQALSNWEETYQVVDSWKPVVPEEIKLQITKEIYEQAKEQGFFQEASPVNAPGFTWQCIKAGVKSVKSVKREDANVKNSTVERRILTHFFAYKPGERYCLNDLFTAVVETRGSTSVAYSPQSFVYNKEAADKTNLCTKHVHYTVNRVREWARCVGEDNYQIKIFDTIKCKATDLEKWFRPPSEETPSEETLADILQLGDCGGKVFFATP